MHQRDSGLWVPGAPPGPDHHLIIPHPPELATEEGQVWVSGRHGHPVLGGVYGLTASGEPIEVVSYEWNEPMRYAVNRARAPSSTISSGSTSTTDAGSAEPLSIRSFAAESHPISSWNSRGVAETST
jgi:hypothetical protein